MNAIVTNPAHDELHLGRSQSTTKAKTLLFQFICILKLSLNAFDSVHGTIMAAGFVATNNSFPTSLVATYPKKLRSMKWVRIKFNKETIWYNLNGILVYR